MKLLLVLTLISFITAIRILGPLHYRYGFGANDWCNKYYSSENINDESFMLVTKNEIYTNIFGKCDTMCYNNLPHISFVGNNYEGYVNCGTINFVKKYNPEIYIGSTDNIILEFVEDIAKITILFDSKNKRIIHNGKIITPKPIELQSATYFTFTNVARRLVFEYITNHNDSTTNIVPNYKEPTKHNIELINELLVAEVNNLRTENEQLKSKLQQITNLL